MRKYHCVIFDCDGVLVDSEPIGNQVLVDMANHLGADINLDYAYRHFKGNSLYKCMERIESLIDSKLPSDFEQNYRQESYERFKEGIKPIEGVEDVLKSIDIPFCVASSGPINKIRLNLEHSGLLHYFEGRIFSCYDIKKWKPNPAIFQFAAEKMGFDVKDCVVVEDSIHGVMAALNGGFNVLGFTAHDYNNEINQKATHTFNTMQQLKKLLLISN